MLVKTSNNIQGVAAANDGLANAVVVALKAHKLKPIALSGQDATEQGVQNIISGWQTMTVWKDTRKLATASAAAAIALAKGQRPKQTGTVKNGSKLLPAYIIPPVSITKANYKQLFNGYLKKSKVCVGDLQEVLHVGSDQGGAVLGAAPPSFSPMTTRPGIDSPARAPRDLEELRLGAGAHGRRLRGPGRRGDGARRRQRRRQVDADQVRRRHPRLRTAARSSSTASVVTSTGRRTRRSSGSRSSTRISRSATTSTSSRTCTSAARPTTCSSGSRSR